jgi:hydroxymethylglutaryl-CoA synthase
MTTYGIDSISFYTSHYYLDLAALASAHGIDANKFYLGLGQHRMGVPSPSEDIVTLAANAAKQALKDQDIDTIDTFIFATESGIDQSKAAGLYVHRLLGLSEHCRVIEAKQACYSGTAAIQLATAWVARHPKQKVLVIASDNARYGLGSRGESSQGCGAVAMVISKNPRVLAIEPEYGIFSDDIMDFWRPNYRTDAFVDGHYSTKMYMHALEKVWTHYRANGGKSFKEHAHHLYHIPIPRLVEKAHKHLAKLNDVEYENEDTLKAQVKDSVAYSREVGNCYTASLYLGLISLLDHAEADLSGKRIGFYSYGSGCVAEYFSGIVQPGYREVVDKTMHNNMLEGRTALSYEEYENFYTSLLPTDGSQYTSPSHPSGAFRLAGIDRHQRIYEKL